VTIDDGLAQAGVQAHIDSQRAIVGTDTALNAAYRLGLHSGGGQSLPTLFFAVKQASKHDQIL
jgi:hypothetical protein